MKNKKGIGMDLNSWHGRSAGADSRTRGPASNYYNRNDGNDEPGGGGGRKTGVLGQIAKHICQRITQDLCNSFFHKIYIVKMP